MPYQQQTFTLTPEQVQKILQDANRTGWQSNGVVVEGVKPVTNPITGANDLAPSGEYTLSIRGPDGTNDVINVAQGEPTLPTGIPGKSEPNWVVAGATAVPPKSPSSTLQTINDPWGGVYKYDPSAPPGQQFSPVVAGDWGKYQQGLTTTAKTQAEYDAMLANQKAGRGLMSDGDWHTLNQAYQRNELSYSELQEKIRQFSQNNALAWAAENRLGTTSAAQNALTAAQTAGTGVETQINTEKLRQLIAMGPAAEQQAILANEVTQAQLDKVRQEMNKPSVQSLGNDMTYGVMTPTGQIEERYRQGYVPKTMADVAARSGQILQLGQAKRDEIVARQKNDPAYTDEQAFADFQSWYDRNVGPQIPALQAAQEEAQQTRGKELAAQRQLNYTSALGAGNQAISAFNASSGEPLDPEFAKLLRGVQSAKVPTDVDYSKMWAGSGLQPKVQQATAEALKYIDPSAAQMAGAPQPTNYSQYNPAEVLNSSRIFYGPNGPQTAPLAAPAAAGTGEPAPGGPGWDLVTGPQDMQTTPALVPGQAGTVAPDDPRRLSPPAAPAAPYDWSAMANVNSDLQELMRKMANNNVYTYGR